VGAQPRNDSCASGLIFIDVSDPSSPKRTGCASGDGYVHDAQCLIYKGPDAKYYGTEICYGYNEDSLTIYNITDKTVTNIISKTSYDGAKYTHQGWVLDTENQEFLLLDDELDERDGIIADQRATTFVWNITYVQPW
jgi:choice-of-anchor B domain-containing protein